MTLIVGEHGKEITVHSKLLTKYSAHFDDNVSGEPTTTPARRIQLYEEDPQVMDMLVRWLYRRNFGYALDRATNWDQNEPPFSILSAIYRLEFTGSVCKHFYESFVLSDKLSTPSPEMLATIFEITDFGCPIRRYLTAKCVHDFLSGGRAEREKDAWITQLQENSELAQEFAVWQLRYGEFDEGPDGRSAEWCDYETASRKRGTRKRESSSVESM